MSKQNVIITELFKSRKNILQLMYNQKYATIKYDGFDINEINTMYTTDQLDIYLKQQDPNDPNNEIDDIYAKKIYICYYISLQPKTLRPNNLQDLIDELFNVQEQLKKETDTLIIILNVLNISDALITFTKQIWETQGIFVVLLTLANLQTNILNHQLVPPHRILSVSEKIHIKQKYNINDNEFPEISRFDPVAKLIGIRPGEVCEIMRPSRTAIESPYYRICVNI